MAHILPHWTWPGRMNVVTPVHVFTSGDEAELFLNDVSLGRKRKGAYEYRLRWDSVVYKPGILRVIAYKNGSIWASDTVKTASAAAKLKLVADRNNIMGDAKDLSFITVSVVDKDGTLVPVADNIIRFEISGPGEIVATDNGDPTDLQSFPSKERKAFSGMALVIIRANEGAKGEIKVKAQSTGLAFTETTLNVQ